VELQSEYFLPREHAAAAIATLRQVGDLIAPVLQISELRTVRADDLWLSPAYGRDSVTFHFTWVADLAAVVPVMRAVEERLGPFQPRPHWGKLTLMAPHEIIASYPRGTDFRKLVATLDPRGKFGNDFLAAFFPAG
jgi:xylitol oxidase